MLGGATGDPQAVESAERAARWILANRSLANSPYEFSRYLARNGRSPLGGFRHDEHDAAGPYLGDNLAMGRAFLALYGATGNRDWLRRAIAAGQFIRQNFTVDQGGATAGFYSAAGEGGLPPIRDVDENISAARFFNLLSHYSGDTTFRDSARQAIRYLAADAVALARISDPGILLADAELAQNPVHVTVVGPKPDAKAQALFAAASKVPAPYKRVEWWDVGEGPMPNPDVQYPTLKNSAAFVCTNKLCSSPISEPEKILMLLMKLSVK